jgi:hypothetical protein
MQCACIAAVFLVSAAICNIWLLVYQFSFFLQIMLPLQRLWVDARARTRAFVDEPEAMKDHNYGLSLTVNVENIDEMDTSMLEDNEQLGGKVSFDE